MLRQFRTLVLVALVVGGLYAASAFDAADTSTRNVTATVVGDSAAYLAMAKNVSSPHGDFVTENGSGVISVSFGSGVATGTGVNPEATYYFDNIINLTNQGTTTVNVQANTTATSGTVKVCVVTPGTAMTNSCYDTTSPASPQSVAVGGRLNMGLMVQADGEVSGGSVSGTIRVVASR